MPQPQHSISGSELSENATSASSPLSAPPQSPADGESDLTVLAHRLAEHGGGAFSMQLSSDLALEIVLNEIVEQAGVAMRASGAAIILERDGEMVCRASSGSTAPALGTRLDTAAGLSGECIRTMHSQRCDDALADPRADSEASEQLGVRSVMVLPLLRNGQVVGIFEVFSAKPFAFSEHEERTAEAFAQRIVKNLDRAAEPPTAASAASVFTAMPVPPAPRPDFAGVPEGVLESLQAGLETIDPTGAALDERPRPPRSRSLDALTWVLALLMLGGVVLLGRRFVWHGSSSASAKPSLATTPSVVSAAPHGLPADSPRPASSLPSATPTAAPSASEAVSSRKSKVRAADSPADSAPAGSLTVFENGREVFHLPPAQSEPAQATPGAVEPASSIEPDQPMRLSPQAAEDSVVHRVEPQYPEEARDQQIQGPVVLDVRIDPSGAVQDVTLVSGQALLARAATDAVKQWRFRPRSHRGRPVEMQTRITLNFKLPK